MSFGTLGDIIQDILFGVKDTGEAAPVALTSQNALKVYIEGGSSGVSSHPALTERDAPSQHPASSIVNTPAGNITSTNVQDAINELDTARAAHYAGIINKPSYTDNGDGTVTIGSGEFHLYSTYSDESAPVHYTVSGGTFTLTDGAINYIYIDYNSGIPAIKHTTTRNDIASTYLMTASPIYTIFRQGTTLFKLDWGQSGLGAAEKLVLRTINLHRYERESGLALADAGSKHFTLTSGVVWYGLNNKTLDAVDSSTDDVHYYYWNGATWVEVATTEFISDYYQDTSGLSSLASGHYAVNWIYRAVVDTKRACILLGTGDYNLAQAEASAAPTSIPAGISAMCMLVGRIIVKKGDTAATQVDSAFSTTLAYGSVSIHNDLSGLQGGTSGEYYHLTSAQYSALVTGSGTSGRITAWTGTNTVGDSTLIKSGEGVLTLSAASSYTLTIPATGTVALGADTLTATTTNNSGIANHTHAVTATDDGDTNTNTILKSGATGELRVDRLGVGQAVTATAGDVSSVVGGDHYPDGDLRGLAARFITPLGPRAYTDHFRSGVIPTGFAWQGAPFGGTPVILAYSSSNDYLRWAHSSAARCFLSCPITNSAAAWQNKAICGRLAAALYGSFGLRIDDGTDNNYVEIYLDATAADGGQRLRFSYRSGGGAVVTNTAAPVLLQGSFVVLRLYCYYSAQTYAVYGYSVNETGSGNNIANFGTPAISWCPTAGRVGLVGTTAAASNPQVCDWFYNTFT